MITMKLAPEQMARSTSPARSPRDGSVRHAVSDGQTDMSVVIKQIIVSKAHSIAANAKGFSESLTNHIAIQYPGKALTTLCRLQKTRFRRNLANHSFMPSFCFGLLRFSDWLA